MRPILDQNQEVFKKNGKLSTAEIFVRKAKSVFVEIGIAASLGSLKCVWSVLARVWPSRALEASIFIIEIFQSANCPDFQGRYLTPVWSLHCLGVISRFACT